MKKLVIPESYNYIAAFLTFQCNLTCSYCINANNTIDRRRKLLSGQEWVKGLERIVTRPGLPITFGGGEPTMHSDFYYLVNALHEKGYEMDLLTNSIFHVDAFMQQVKPEVFKREALYASIRVSYHPETMKANVLLDKVSKMLQAGYHIGIWAVGHPKYSKEIFDFGNEANKRGIDFRLKEFLGTYEGRVYGSYKYDDACVGVAMVRQVQCKTSELIIGPNGNIYRCHTDLYIDDDSHFQIGNILDEQFEIEDKYRRCDVYGFCNPCDIKVKYDRFQQMGHCAVDIIK